MWKALAFSLCCFSVFANTCVPLKSGFAQKKMFPSPPGMPEDVAQSGLRTAFRLLRVGT